MQRIALGLVLVTTTAAASPARPPETSYADAAARILEAAQRDDGAWRKLEHLTDRIGNRISGSPALDRAIAWAQETLKADGHENVHAERVMVPHWVRGAEAGEIVRPVPVQMHLLGLGGSPGTPRAGVTAPVLVIHDFDELRRRAADVHGRIVLFDRAMPPFGPEGTGYGAAVEYRTRGPARAAKLGAVAALVRSVTAKSLRSPHTGATRFRAGERMIPAAAISIEDATLIERLAAAGDEVVVHLTMGARILPDVPSANVVGELRGREKPEEIVLIGGHIDSWDVGQGAHDDGAGCVMAMQALTLLRRAGLVPRRTIRVVLFTNEENGLAGGKTYAKEHAAELGRHVAAIETDSGGFRAQGFGVETGKPARAEAMARVAEIGKLLAPVQADRVVEGHGGADISEMGYEGVPMLGFNVDQSTYFDIHHSFADTLDKVDPKLLALDAGVLAVMAYVLADMPDTLPRSPTIREPDPE